MGIKGTRFINWGGTVNVRPAAIHYPRSEEEVAAIVKAAADAGRCVRVVGSGHSWTRLCETTDTLVSLEEMQGLREVDRQSRQVSVRAGTKLDYLGELLRQNGLALENMGDIDQQSIAGVLGTGTHGTGIEFGILATQVRRLRMVTGTGQIMDIGPEDGDTFRAALVGLGAIGIITEVTLQAVPAYNLRADKTHAPLEATLQQVGQLRRDNRNYEFFWFPYSDIVLNKRLNETTAYPKDQPTKKFLVDVVWENGSFKLLSETVRLFPGLSRRASRLAAAGMAAGVEVLPSHKLYPTTRLVRFYEMEYGLPAEKGPEAIRMIRDIVREKDIQVHFPIEYRYVKGDDILLSPAEGGDRCFISVHMYKGMDYKPYFDALEPMFQRLGGRPHWGKMHTCSAAYLHSVYPQLERWLAVRAQLDPAGVFLNDYLRNQFNIRAAVPETAS